MIDCINADVRDALPDLFHGRLGDLDKATMTAHVESCADCRAELAIMERVRAHAPLTPAIDISRIVSMLPAPVPMAQQQLSPSTHPARMPLLWKLAAAAALIVGGTLTFSKARGPDSAASSVASVTPARSDSEGATSVLTPASKRVAIATPTPSATVKSVVASSVTGLSLTGGVQDLTDSQLEALVNDVDNVEGLPAAEPEAISVSVDGGEGLQ